MEFSIEEQRVFHLKYKDEWGRWIVHSTHYAYEDAKKSIRTAKTQLNKPQDWGSYVEEGKGGPRRNPYGE